MNTPEKFVGSVVATVVIIGAAAVLTTVDLLIQIKRKVLG